MKQVFGIWDNSAQMARDLGESDNTVRAWKKRKSIPSDRDVKLVEAANSRGHLLTFEHLAKLRAGDHDVVIPATDCNGDTPEAA